MGRAGCAPANAWEPADYGHFGPLAHGGRLFFRGLLEPIARSPAARHSIVVDVGANRGKVATLLASCFPDTTPLYLFECFSDHALYLRHTLFANPNWRNNVHVKHLVVADAHGETRAVRGPSAEWMADPRRRASLQTAGLLGGPFLWRKAGREDGAHVLEHVLSTTLDAQFGEERIAFLKIDAEGADGRVLRGAHTLLAERRVLAVYWESFPLQERKFNDSLASDVEWLRALGYRSYLAGRRMLLPLTATCRTSGPYAHSQVMNAVAFADEEIERTVLERYWQSSRERGR